MKAKSGHIFFSVKGSSFSSRSLFDSFKLVSTVRPCLKSWLLWSWVPVAKLERDDGSAFLTPLLTHQPLSSAGLWMMLSDLSMDPRREGEGDRGRRVHVAIGATKPGSCQLVAISPKWKPYFFILKKGGAVGQSLTSVLHPLLCGCFCVLLLPWGLSEDRKGC